MDTDTYADYLRSVKAQEQRDRDRFMGWDSHPEEPAYSADRGVEWSSGAVHSVEWNTVPAPPRIKSAVYWDDAGLTLRIEFLDGTVQYAPLTIATPSYETLI